MDKAKPDIPEAPGELNLSAFTDLSSPESAKQLEDAQISRGRLVGPVFLILFVSFSSILGFMWLSSRDLNEEALARDRLVLANLLGAERIQLEESARREAASDELYTRFVESEADPSSRAAARATTWCRSPWSTDLARPRPDCMPWTRATSTPSRRSVAISTD